MKNYRALVLSALAASAVLTSTPVRADNMASIAIAPATGAVTLVPRWGIGGNLAGFHHMAQDLSLGGGANQFYSIKNTGIPAGGDILAFNAYIAGSGAATPHADIGSKLTPEFYRALTSADPDFGYGSVNFYLIHHKSTGDYFSVIKPSSGTASAVIDLKPMSGPGGPATLGGSGYFGFTFAAANLGYGLNLFYYLRTDPVTGFTKFGTLEPALLSTSADKFDLGLSGHNALAFTGTDVGYGTDKMYFLRLDPITGFTILGTLHPVTGKASDIANLGSVFSTLTFVPGDVGFGTGKFYTTGSINTQWQSVSFAAIADRLISAGSFTVNPTASSGLPIALTVVPGSTGSASISGPVAGVFTVTPTSPGVITLQAAQAGQLGAYAYNMLRQSFTATGVATLVITTQPSNQSAVAGTTATFSVSANGSTPRSFQWRKAGVNIAAGNASATTAILSLTNVQAVDAASYDVVVTNASGSIVSNAVTLAVTTAAPIITNSPLTAALTVGTPFTFSIAASGSPTGYTAAPLPAGLSIAAATGVITGTPTTVGTTNVLLGATNATGTGNATLVVTVAAAGVAPIITNSPLTAAGTVGTPFSFTITASGTPTSYTAAPLPAGLSIVAATGVITGTPTTVGTTNVLLGAINATGTGNATLVVTVAAAGVAPIITNSPLTAAGTVGTPFSFTITASGTPTSYTAAPLPAGLSIVAATGVITGTPTTVGTTNVLLGATNATGTGNATLVVTVAAAGVAPIITNSPLTAAGTVGTPFSFTITASGTPTAYTAAPLPAGLSIVAATGVITGTPTTVGTTNVLLSATNTTGTGNATLVVTVAAAGVAPIITNSPLTAAGTVGTPFSFTITASGTPTVYAASPLPAGLSIVAATGVITGTPTTTGTTNVLLGATNTTGTGNATLVVTVAAAGVAPIITNSPLTAAGTVGTPISFTITASGLPTSYTAAPLPAGLSIVAATGVITGTPTTVGTTNVLLGATNATGTGNATLVVTVAAAGVAPIITNSPLSAAGTVGTPFSFTITASGLPTSYTAAPLPAGLSIVAATGVITGTPTTTGTTNVLLGATNATGTGNATLVVTVAAAGVAPIITNSPLSAAGTVGTPFSFTITASGLPTSYTAAPLPAGLSIVAATGVITGTPTTVGTTNVLLGATNATGTGNATVVVTVAAAGVAPIITNSPLTAAGTVGTPFSFTMTATGLPTNYTAAPLPAGLSLVAATGIITGTPTTVGTTNVLLGATNATGTGNATLVVTVAAAGVAPIITSSPLSAAGTVGTPFSFTITATGTPTSFSAPSLPLNGLSIVAATGVITGIPTSAATMIVPIGATNATGTDTATLTITIASVYTPPVGPPVASEPIITSPETAAGSVGTPFATYLITATGSPTSYATSELPAGLTLTALTGAINGTPTEPTIAYVTLFATNASGTGTSTLKFTIAPASAAPIITSATSVPGTVGTPFATYLIAATGSPSRLTATGLPAGLTFNALSGAINGTPTSAGTTVATLTASNSAGTGSLALTFTIAPVAVAPIITSSGIVSGTVGQPFVTYRIAATGLPTSYGATGLPAGLSVNPLTGAITGTPTAPGNYTVTLLATNAAGTSSSLLTLTIAPMPTSRLVNFSARALSGPGDQSLIMGFVVVGNGKNLLVRGIGPTLATFGVINELQDPLLSLFNGQSVIATNDDWQTNSGGPTVGALIATTAARVGAFALPNGSKDAALLFTVNNGAHTTGLLRPDANSTTGVALVEIYDTDTTADSRLVNVAARMNVTPGEGTLIAGFSIGGNAPKTVLIRGVGPVLSGFGVSGVLTDPTIAVYSGRSLMAANDNWEVGTRSATELRDVSVRVGAFALPAGSRDAALLITLPPGLYTVQVTGVGNTSGIALVEIYDTL
jgi:hypothetical protein